MKKIINVLVLALLATGMSLTAQNRVDSAHNPIRMKRGMPGIAAMKDLNLTDDQKAKLIDLRKQFVAQDSLSKGQQGFRRGNGNGQVAPFAQGPMMGRMQGQMRGQMQGRFQGRMQGRIQGRFQGRMQGRMLANRGFRNAKVRMHKAPMVNPEIRIQNQVERMTKQLNLTPEQAAKIQAIQEKHFKKDIARYKKFEKKRDAQFKKRHGNLDEIKAVLTPDQAKKFENLKTQVPRMNGQGFQGGRNQGPNGPRGPMPGFGNGE